MDTFRLNPIERDLVRAVAAGEEMHCSDCDPASLASSDYEGHVIQAKVIRDILLGHYVEHLDPRGLRLRGARIIGPLDLARLVPVTGLELSSCAVDELVSLRGARLPWLTLYGTHLPALDAEDLHVEGSVDFRELEVKADSGTVAAVSLVGAHIGGQLNCNRAVFTNTSGPALLASGLQVAGWVLLLDGFRAETCSCADGTVQLVGAHIGGEFQCDGVLKNSDGPALVAEGLQADRSVDLRNVSIEANSKHRAALWLLSARIGGTLQCDGAVLKNSSGSALIADGLQVDRSVYLRSGFRAIGSGSFATVKLAVVKIAEVLDFHDGRICSSDEEALALDLRSSSVGRLWLPRDAICQSREVDDAPAKGTHGGRLYLDGFTYSALDPRGASPKQWLCLLREQTPEYAVQPYEQLAATYRAAGDDATARQVLIAQQDDLLCRGKLGSRRARTWHRLKRLTVGYGYQSWRALVGLIVAMLLAVALGLAAGHIPISAGRYVGARTSATGAVGTACSTVEQIGLGIDLGLPAINTGIGNRCALDTTSQMGQALVVAGWFLQAAAWALATLFVVGYTGLIRKI
jgi:hypothetical protein